MNAAKPSREQALRLMAGLEGLRLDLEVLKASLLQLNQDTDALLTSLRTQKGGEA